MVRAPTETSPPNSSHCMCLSRECYYKRSTDVITRSSRKTSYPFEDTYAQRCPHEIPPPQAQHASLPQSAQVQSASPRVFAPRTRATSMNNRLSTSQRSISTSLEPRVLSMFARIEAKPSGPSSVTTAGRRLESNVQPVRHRAPISTWITCTPFPGLPYLCAATPPASPGFSTREYPPRSTLAVSASTRRMSAGRPKCVENVKSAR
ncbi:hypothetical protein SAMN05192539_105927 [Paraburkholderia diazotrophica]|uniref:Uncharacterized protein n=1 Tax=Paraburkholderia diazotrophica TaxID=667676 RepID=A0A1H7EFF6_9BURK|nr:hypothetical protein SAMN05192539_105927 [Paraburkholderia diazotrophica]